MGWRNVDTIIEQKLLLGNLTAACTPRTISERRITHIVSVCMDPIPADLPAGGIKHLRIPVEDRDYVDLLIHFPAACRFIHQAITEGGTVLVHCNQGASRSATIVAAYLMASRQLSSADAQNLVRRAREQVWILPGFQEQLGIWGICQYNITPDNGIYRNWRITLENYMNRA
ncbi:phosphatases II [Thelephora terrestris]|uniref:protein-tyrosine-phosphatase n=1 Tax=Thelephora terrestris TaxID=56493 RepID=A0A9P6H617_9AGAM|nr:phosphatases II [Thelephora terrestris]